MRGGGRRAACATAIAIAVTALAGCRAYVPPRPDPAISGRVNSKPPARLRHSCEPSAPPMDWQQAWIVEQECSGCHSFERVQHVRLDWKGWRGEVGHMVQNGAELTPAEQQAIVDYLARRN